MIETNVKKEQQQLHSLLPLGEGGRRPNEGADVVRSYTSKVSEVSRVSEVSKMSKQGEQQSLHSLRPMGEGGRRPDEGLKETVRCNSDEMLKQVQHDGKGLAKDAQSQCPPLETLPNINNPVDCFCERKPKSLIPRRGSERSELLTPHQGRLACTTTLETAKEVRSTSSCTFAPWGEGQDEGSYQCDKTDITPHQGRLACTTTLETAKGGQQSLHSFAPWGEGRDEGSDKSALTHGETAKDANDSLRHPELVSGSHHAASLEDVTPHQVRTKLAKRSLSPTILSPSGEELRDVTRHEATEPKNVKDLTS